jgi:endonuclease-3 related protein
MLEKRVKAIVRKHRTQKKNAERLREAGALASGAAPLLEYYHALLHAYGPQKWWGGETRFEVIVGAILIQNTNWRNAERALAALRGNGLLNPAAMEKVELRKLAALIRSSGYFREKARKLKEFLKFLRREYGGSLAKMFSTPTEVLREQLLAVHGIGPETADSILLYAGNRAVFVVDAYARRILARHGLAKGTEGYEHLRKFFEANLRLNASLFNEYHALIVYTGKNYCRPKVALCEQCALRPFLPGGALVRI